MTRTCLSVMVGSVSANASTTLRSDIWKLYPSSLLRASMTACLDCFSHYYLDTRPDARKITPSMRQDGDVLCVISL